MMRVLIVSDYAYASGGVETLVRDFISHGSSAVDCKLLTWRSDALAPPAFAGRVVMDCGDVRPAWDAMDWADVLFVHTSWNLRMLAALAVTYGKRTAKPIVTVVHTSGHSQPDSASIPAQEAWLSSLLDLSASVVGVSEAVTERLRLLAGHTSHARLVTIENAARLINTSPRPRDDRRVVSFIGRPIGSKGFDFFLRLARDLEHSGLSFFANTVVPYEGAPDGVHLSWALSDADLLAFFDRADLLVAPYAHVDGLPLAVLEAINCGVPIVGFDTAPVGDLLRRYGLMVIPAEYSALLRVVEAWRSGSVHPPAATPGCVPPLAERFNDYLALLANAAGRP